MSNEPTQNPEENILRLREDLIFSIRKSGDKGMVLIESADENRFLSIGELEYQLLAFLDGKRTQREVFEAYLEKSTRRSRRVSTSESEDESEPEKLDWEQATQLFQFLQQEKLLSHVNNVPLPEPDSSQSSKFAEFNPIGARFRLFQADQISEKLNSWFGFLFSPIAVALFVVVMIWASWIAISDFSNLLRDTRLMIRPENLLWMTVFWILLKLVHESGHAISCKRWGGKVGNAGLNFILMFPLPFVDVTSSWRFSTRWRRMVVAAAGIYFELFIAAIFLVIWSMQWSPLINSLSIQIVLMASLTTFLFNANPLMKFDGYFLLSDMLNRPNLYKNGMIYQREWLKANVLGMEISNRVSDPDLFTRIYGWMCAIWRIAIAAGLIFAAANLFHGAGIVLAAFAILCWYVIPLVSFLKTCFGPEKKQSISPARIGMVAATIALLVYSLSWVAWPFAPSAVAVVHFHDSEPVRCESAGFVKKIHVSPGEKVNAGQLLIQLENPDLDFELASLKIDRNLSQIKAKTHRKKGELGEFQAELKAIQSFDEQIAILEKRQKSRTVYATQSGRVVADNLSELEGAFVRRGDHLLEIVPDESLEVTGYVPEHLASLFRNANGMKARMRTEDGRLLPVVLNEVEPKATRQVEDTSLVAEFGGPLTTRPIGTPDQSDSLDSTELATPVFAIRTNPIGGFNDLDNGKFYSGQRGRLYLESGHQNCLSAIRFHFSNWWRRNWNPTGS